MQSYVLQNFVLPWSCSLNLTAPRRIRNVDVRRRRTFGGDPEIDIKRQLGLSLSRRGPFSLFLRRESSNCTVITLIATKFCSMRKMVVGAAKFQTNLKFALKRKGIIFRKGLPSKRRLGKLASLEGIVELARLILKLFGNP